jgi:hypothetical protein
MRRSFEEKPFSRVLSENHYCCSSLRAQTYTRLLVKGKEPLVDWLKARRFGDRGELLNKIFRLVRHDPDLSLLPSVVKPTFRQVPKIPDSSFVTIFPKESELFLIQRVL